MRGSDDQLVIIIALFTPPTVKPAQKSIKWVDNVWVTGIVYFLGSQIMAIFYIFTVSALPVFHTVNSARQSTRPIDNE